MKRSILRKYWDNLVQNQLRHTIGAVVFYSLSSLVTYLVPIFILWSDVIALPIRMQIVLAVALTLLFLVSILLFFSRTQDVRLSRGTDNDFFADLFAEAKTIQIFNTFIPNIELIADDLRNAIERGTKVEILILRPDCDEVKYRATTLKWRYEEIEAQITKTLNVLRDRVANTSNASNLLEVRVYQSWAPFAMYGTENVAMFGYFLYDCLAIEGTQLIIYKSNIHYAQLTSQFKAIWHAESTKTLPLRNWRRELEKIK